MNTFVYQEIYEDPFEYNGDHYGFDPHLPVPVDEDHEDYGKTLKQVLGMTDTEADAIVTAQKWKQIRRYRDSLLQVCDWTQGDDVPVSIKNPYQKYRQALRDITTTTSPEDLVWPAKPDQQGDTADDQDS